MKNIITLLVCLCSICMSAQRFDWVTTAGYSGVANSYNGAIGIARDSQGNLYTLDAANGTQQCQGVSAIPFGTNTNLFLYKFNAAGAVIYIKPIGANFKPLNLVVGENDNIYVLGSLMGTSTIQVNNEVLTDTENRNYIFKFDSTGNLIWKAKNNVSFGNFKESSMLLFANNHIYFQSGQTSISKLNTAGQYVSTLTADAFTSATSATGVFFRGAGVLSNGDLVFAATSAGTITYGETVLVPTENSFTNVSMLTIRTTESLGLIWANYTNGLQNPEKNTIPLTIGNDNGIYTGIQVSTTTTAGPDTITNTATGGNSVGAVLKMDLDGTKIWLKSLTNGLRVWTILNNPNGSGVFCGGEILSNVSVNIGSTSVNPNIGRSFISKIDYSGIFLNSFAFVTGSELNSHARSLATDSSGIFYVGGILNGNASPFFSCVSRVANRGLYLAKFIELPDTAPTPTITISENTLTASPIFSGTIQWFLNGNAISGANSQTFTATQIGNYTVSYSFVEVPACVSTSASITFSTLGINSFENAINNIVVYPNPTSGKVTISLENEKIDKIEIIDLVGKLVAVKNTPSSQIDLSEMEHGIYLFNIHSGTKVIQKKVIKQ